MKSFFKKLGDKLPRYQKIVTSFLYVTIFVIIGFTFWEFHYVGESVSPDIYDKTLEVLLGLLGITGGMKVSETVSEAVQKVAECKYSIGAQMRGGE